MWNRPTLEMGEPYMNADMLEISQSVSDILNDALTPEEIDEIQYLDASGGDRGFRSASCR